MERLQAAIEKARAQRENSPPPLPRAPLADPAAAPRQTHPQTARPIEATAGASASVDDAWAALDDMRLQTRNLHTRRVMTLDAGPDAAPFDLLRTRLLQQAKQHGWRRIGFVSPHSGCGKTTTVANLAFSLSRQLDARSLVLDCDLRRRGLSEVLRQKPATDFAEVLEGRVAFANHGQRFRTNVAFGFNSKSSSNASEILQAGKTQEVLTALEDTYAPDIVLFDLPPLMASDDNFGFLHKLDAALILAAAEKTTMSQIDVAERQVAELTNVMGVVLNRCRYTDGAYGHEYNYY